VPPNSASGVRARIRRSSQGAADDVPELRQLVEREPPQEPPHPRDPGVAAVDGEAGALRLGADDHRPELEQLEGAPALAHANLAIEDGSAVLELDPERGEPEQRRRRDQAESRERDVGRAVQRVPSAGSHVAGTPRRR
jgi:hypothetical protein